ncbi:MAG: endonuclease [bacterium]
MRSPRWRILLTLIAATLLLVTGCSEERRGPTAPGYDAPQHLLEFNPKAIPPGYYDTVDDSTPAALRTTLHDVIDDHTKIPYTSTATDTWDVLEAADEDPNDSGRILDVYLNASYPKYGEGNIDYNREHTWAKSYGFPSDLVSNYPYTDCHHLFLCNDSYNTSRSNKPFRYCDAACLEKPTEVNDGMGGGSGAYPGNSNWTSGSYTEGTWETWIGRRGDIARAQLYMDVRYEGGTHGVTGYSEPDLILTDTESLIADSNTGSNESVAYMGMLSVLLEWHLQDPVDDRERARNDAVYAEQGNRNPFIDHPEWVDCLFNDNCGGGDVTPPAAPTGLAAVAGDGVVNLDWDDNVEADLDGYTVYRATSSGGPYNALNGALVGSSDYTDNTVTNGTTYYYVVTASDLTGNESDQSGEVSATPQGGQPPATVWINEFHYDNDGSDKNEFVEVAGPAGTSLAGWSVLGYNGADGSIYDTVTLTGTFADQEGGFGTLAFEFTGMQNGSPDGLALVDDQGAVVEFLSYEGAIVATGGPAAGMTSVDIGISEPADTPRRYSLQLAGTGTQSSDFHWEGPLPKTDGDVNTNQNFSGGGDTTPPVAPTGLAAVAGDGVVDLDWDDNSEGDLDGYTVYRATSAGGPYNALNASLIFTSTYTDNTVSNGTTYYYVVTASDLTGNESAQSDEVSATPQGGTSTPVHIGDITLTTTVIRNKEYGHAAVLVLDDQGTPVQGATVSGTFTGDIPGGDSAVTGSDGIADLTSPKAAKPTISFTFCVDSISGSGLTYDSGANVETCDSH